MRILIIGSGGREYAVIKSLSRSEKLDKKHIYWYSDFYNHMMLDYATLAGIGSTDNFKTILHICNTININIVFIGPEYPISKGLVDFLEENGYPCVAPTKKLAEIETSKSFGRKFLLKNNMEKYCPKIFNILEPEFEFQEEDKLIIVDQLKDGIVIKADGLHGGKGVKVMGDHFSTIQEGVDIAFEIFHKKEKVIIEEKLVGEEFSLISFTDGKTCLHTVPVKDFKRAYKNDKGPNTGSMGSITGYEGNLWFLDDDILDEAKSVNEKTVRYLEEEKGQKYKGILYGSYMITKEGLKVIEFNCRFGDPECINILSLLKTDLLEIFERITNGTLDQINLEFEKKASVFKYKVPTGYPDNPSKGFPIKIDYDLSTNMGYDLEESIIFANVSKNGEELIGLGSRTLGIIEKNKDLETCAECCNQKMNFIEGKMYYRTDIGLNMSISYEDSGVNIEEGNSSIDKIKQHVESTYNQKTVSKFGDFNGQIVNKGETLVASTDGVGTKSILVLDYLGKIEGFDVLGHDIVNHCINDILVSGAKPLFFLDYFAGSKISSEYVEAFVKGVSECCKETDTVLLGGETAEMPNVYNHDHYDLVGTIVGTKCLDINPKNISDNDIVLGIPSSGPHTNGYSLIRNVLDRYTQLYDKDKIINIYEQLCQPHRRYYEDINNILDKKIKINGLCHITGGGFEDNPKRVLPGGLNIEYNNWKFPAWAEFIQKKGVLSDKEMKKVFNCGIGMMIFINKENYDLLTKSEILLDYIEIGKVVKLEEEEIEMY